MVVCADIGSTYTKAALVDTVAGRLVVRAEHPTTLGTDVMEGLDRCVDHLAEADPRARDAELLACSSAGGGLRIAVVGNEALVTAEAGRRVALSSGGRVVHVSAGAVDHDGLRDSRPDVVLLVGGTDGGNAEVLLRCARQLAGWPGPVVVAGNRSAAGEAGSLLDRAGTPHLLTDNVVPRIGVLAPEPARAAIREMFLAHVIGGKHLSASPDFARAVIAATPDAVLRAVELLARGCADSAGVGDVVVVDVGGATTDVYSVVEPTDDEAPGGLSREVVATSAVNRTVEGDLGVHWSAGSTVQAALAEGAVVSPEATGSMTGSITGSMTGSMTGPARGKDADVDAELAGLALGIALRRHAGRSRVRFDPAGGGRVVERSGVDLREVALVVGSGGALRHAEAPVRIVADRLGPDGEWQLPRAPRVVVDRDYVLAPAGLLAGRHPAVAHRLLVDALGSPRDG